MPEPFTLNSPPGDLDDRRTAVAYDWSTGMTSVAIGVCMIDAMQTAIAALRAQPQRSGYGLTGMARSNG